MKKHRGTSSADDDFVKPKKNQKIENSSKNGAKGGASKDTKSESAKVFRANFGPLYDLFRDLESEGLMSKELIEALEKTPFRDMLRVFIHNKIRKEELSKSIPGLEKLINTFTKTEDGKYGFILLEDSDVFISTPEDMAVDWDLQLLENGIENKLLNERKVTPRTNDLCKRYNFGESSPPVVKSTDVQVAILDAIKNGRVEYFVRLVIFYMCQTFFFTKTGNFSLPCEKCGCNQQNQLGSSYS